MSSFIIFACAIANWTRKKLPLCTQHMIDQRSNLCPSLCIKTFPIRSGDIKAETNPKRDALTGEEEEAGDFTTRRCQRRRRWWPGRTRRNWSARRRRCRPRGSSRWAPRRWAHGRAWPWSGQARPRWCTRSHPGRTAGTAAVAAPPCTATSPEATPAPPARRTPRTPRARCCWCRPCQSARRAGRRWAWGRATGEATRAPTASGCRRCSDRTTWISPGARRSAARRASPAPRPCSSRADFDQILRKFNPFKYMGTRSCRKFGSWSSSARFQRGCRSEFGGFGGGDCGGRRSSSTTEILGGWEKIN